MKKVSWLFTFTHVPGVMKRSDHVLIALQASDGKIALGKKDIYPSHIARLIGGGTDGQAPEMAAVRELDEEVGLTLEPKDLTHIADIDATIIESSSGKQYLFTTHLYFASYKDAVLVPADDLDGIEYYSQPMLANLIKAYEQLSDELVSVGADDDESTMFRWADYGAYYGRVHQLVYDYIDAQ